MEEKITQFIRKHSLIEEGDNVIAAVSGGADSVALFHFLLKWHNEGRIRLRVAHFEHGLRGRDSQEDANFVEALCEKHGIECFLRHGRMLEATAPGGMGTEEWGRALRYAFFEELAEQCGAKVATAHTLSDNAETVLFHAVRGTSTRGLAGIPPRRGCFIRPMLEVSRREVEAYCAANGLQYRQDETNFCNIYSRNLLRNEVLPLLEQVHPGAVAALGHLAEDMRALDGWLEEQAGQVLALARKKPGWWQWGGAFADEAEAYAAPLLQACPAPVKRKALAMLTGADADRAALDRLEAVLERRMAATQLPGGKTARRQKERLVLEKTKVAGESPQPTETPLAFGPLRLPGGVGVDIGWQNDEFLTGKCKKTARKDLTFFGDYDKIINCSVFRTRREGDRFEPRGRGVTKPLKKWMNEEGVPPGLRDRLPVLACGDVVYWVWGYGFGQAALPGADAGRLLVIKYLE